MFQGRAGGEETLIGHRSARGPLDDFHQHCSPHAHPHGGYVEKRKSRKKCSRNREVSSNSGRGKKKACGSFSKHLEMHQTSELPKENWIPLTRV